MNYRFQKTTMPEMTNTQEVNKTWYFQQPETEKTMIYVGQGWCLSSWAKAGSDNGLDHPVLWQPLGLSFHQGTHEHKGGSGLGSHCEVRGEEWPADITLALKKRICAGCRKACFFYAQKTKGSFHKKRHTCDLRLAKYLQISPLMFRKMSHLSPFS